MPPRSDRLAFLAALAAFLVAIALCFLPVLIG